MYDCREFTFPVWKGNRVLNESFLPRTREIKLLYRADRIERVTNLSGTRVFTEGRDYVLKDGGLHIPEGSDIHVMSDSEYAPPSAEAKTHSEAGFKCTLGGYLMFGEGHFFHDLEYAVTYTHSENWTGFVPAPSDKKLPLTKSRIRTGTPFVFGFLGDSIGQGANASGLTGAEPFTPIWPEMVCQRLSLEMGAEVKCVNASLGGMNSDWGKKVVTEKFADTVPDVLLIEFGMNDATGGTDRNVFIGNCREIADSIRKLNPECELIFVSTTLPNPLSFFLRDHETHEPLLANLSEEFGECAELVPMTSLHKCLLEKKNYWDMTGNNINHPNDFLVRVYAQAILAVLGL